MMRLWVIPLFAVMAACLPARGEAAEAECERAALYRLSTEKAFEESVWFSLDRYRGLESTCGSDPDYGSYHDYRAQLESLVGNHAAALSHMDLYLGNLYSDQDSPRDFSAPATSVPAVEYVVERARDHRVVMVNEWHHASSDRLLTMDLLAPLAEQGFRYLAIEAGWNGDPINTRGYPIVDTGYYVNDVVFAEVIRSALELGYRIIPYEFRTYEVDDEQRKAVAEQFGLTTRMNEREWWQAKNIVTRVFDIDSDAKLLVHAGGSHISESRRETWAPMAHFLREFTGLDPLTVDQTAYSEHSRPEFEHPLRRRAGELGLLREDAAVMLVDSEGEPMIMPPESIDLAVLGASTRYADGRPTWMNMDGRRNPTAFDTPECAERTCIVEARRAGFADELPLDRIEVTSAENTTLYLPPGGDVVVYVKGLDQSLLATRNVRAPKS